MPVKQGTFGTSPIYNGVNKIGKIYRGIELFYTSSNPLVDLISRQIKKATIGGNGNIEIIGDYSFSDCTKLTDLNILTGIKSTGISSFDGCSSLKNVTIANTVQTIGNLTFSGCTSLTTITLPESVTSIGGSAFYGCTSMTTMTILATTPPTLSAVSDIPGSVTTIYVPSASLSAYTTANTWKDLLTRDQPVTFVGI